jgi:hypothetical protein
MKPAALLLASFLLGVGITLAAVFDNADRLYAWYWQTFVYEAGK